MPAGKRLQSSEDSTAEAGHVARSVTDNEEITSTKNNNQVGKEHAGHSNGHQQKRASGGALM
jgi:hypothetical protein